MTHYNTAHVPTQLRPFPPPAISTRTARSGPEICPDDVAGNPGSSEAIKERQGRVGRAVLGGERVAAEDMRANEGWFVKAHHGIYRALATARGLTGDQLRYLLCLLEYSLGLGSTYAARDFSGTPPTIGDWSRWLGGMNEKQIYRAKRTLFNAGVILFLDGDTDRVALNLHWETWRVRWDGAKPGRNPSGRPLSPSAEQLALWAEMAPELAAEPVAGAQLGVGAPIWNITMDARELGAATALGAKVADVDGPAPRETRVAALRHTSAAPGSDGAPPPTANVRSATRISSLSTQWTADALPARAADESPQAYWRRTWREKLPPTPDAERALAHAIAQVLAPRLSRAALDQAYVRCGVWEAALAAALLAPESAHRVLDRATAIQGDGTASRESQEADSGPPSSASAPPVQDARMPQASPAAAAGGAAAQGRERVDEVDAAPRLKHTMCWPDHVIERMKARRTYRPLSESPYSRAQAYEDVDHWGQITLVCQDEATRRRIEQDRDAIDEAWRDLYREPRARLVALRLAAETPHLPAG